eukprot:COSAG05_NODE_3765_length_1850_cov_1.398629_3_plen_224_part_00
MAQQRGAAEVFDLSGESPPGSQAHGASAAPAAKLPPVIEAAQGSCGQYGPLIADLYERLLRADPDSAAAAVQTHEVDGSQLRRRNANIAGTWKLYCFEEGSTECGSISFSKRAKITSDLYVSTTNPESGAYELFASASNIAPKFKSLNVESLVFATKSKIMRRWIKGELTITLLDADTFHGALATQDDTDPDGYGRDPERFRAEFTGKRCHMPPVKKHKGRTA